jgi:hypothetical protein
MAGPLDPDDLDAARDLFPRVTGAARTEPNVTFAVRFGYEESWRKRPAGAGGSGR